MRGFLKLARAARFGYVISLPMVVGSFQRLPPLFQSEEQRQLRRRMIADRIRALIAITPNVHLGPAARGYPAKELAARSAS